MLSYLRLGAICTTLMLKFHDNLTFISSFIHDTLVQSIVVKYMLVGSS